MSQVLPAVPTGNLDQRWGHGIWVGKAPMTDEHIILTENAVQKARSLHRVPPEEKFVISELKKVRGLPWNGRAENLKATIVTQQDQGSSGHRRLGSSQGMVQRLAAVAVSVWVHTHKHVECDWKRHWLTRERVQGPVGAGVGPITEPATESQEPAPAARQEPASSSSRLASPMPTQHLQNEQMDSQLELAAQERRERKRRRGQTRRQQVKSLEDQW